MTNFCRRSEAVVPRRMRYGGLGAVISACAMLAASLHPVANASAHASMSDADHQPSDEGRDPYAGFIAKYTEWARRIEAEGMERGTPLTTQQIALASEIGIEHPENVRLVFVDAVPFPADDEDMRETGESLGFIGPDIINNAQAFGYSIWVREGYSLDRPSLAHELVHVAQIERSASFREYVSRYMSELLEYGHRNMPLEVEAYEANRRYQ
ncbi:hypothetical protein I5E68_05980 [Novosphingobium sp. YJ-S2-02]|uniref:DUF4157 domain-containing protein n=1 Tax=Novosphingobium aureum TaxID=2792964 RepID=A0A931HBN1_9SPHN|nr:hypothetical protein [Novosphingobium aureum]MBH0112499.1 hypothetical protein [Novosphingobium aureum]